MSPTESTPVILEHPNGEYVSAREAIEEAFKRIRAAGDKRWALLSGQGQGSRADAYHIEDVSFRNDEFEMGEPVADVTEVARRAGLDPSEIETQNGGRIIRVPNASPKQLAAFLDLLFTERLGIRPFDDEHDYAFGAEWKEAV